jgi:hypothetical protein
VTRSDAIACGGRCRVHLHRHPELLDIHRRALARMQNVASLFEVLEIKAAYRLLPEREVRAVFFGRPHQGSKFTRSPAAKPGRRSQPVKS